jgi:hypothetical protein
VRINRLPFRLSDGTKCDVLIWKVIGEVLPKDKLHEMFSKGGMGCRYVRDTGSAYFALVVGNKPLSDSHTKEAWKLYQARTKKVTKNAKK